jgi:hypothetical protein
MIPNIRRSEARRLDGPIADATSHWDPRRFEHEPYLVLASVIDATPIAGAWARWVYECEEAWLGSAPLWNSATRTLGRTFPKCFSVSEMSNGSPPTKISYGVDTNNLLGSFLPVRIPDGTRVIMSPHRTSTGELVWLIINTQAIDGTCVGSGGGADLPVNPGGL